jgi:pimeloyl-ACP methyl ester carboxylesterase
MKRAARLLTIALISMQTGCGGGGSSDTNPPPPPTNNMEPEPITLLDNIPAINATGVAVANQGFSLIHRTDSGSTYTLDVMCDFPEHAVIWRELSDMSDMNENLLVDHKVRCTDELQAQQNVQITVNETRSNGDAYIAELPFTTGSEIANPALSTLDARQTPSSQVNEMFETYVQGALVDSFELPVVTELLLVPLLQDLASSEWDHLANPDAQFDTLARRVSYGSFKPNGQYDDSLTGLVVSPNVADPDGFIPREQIILLAHATGSTPGNLDDRDAWYIYANLLSSRGYIVVAPDNYGRGGSAEYPETYLQINRTGQNAVHLLAAVLGADEYQDYRPEAVPIPVSIIGYSQGGHSSIAIWQEITRLHGNDVLVRSVHAGAGPYNLYQTFRGVLTYLDGSCDASSSTYDYCRLVDPEATIPFATDRILPPLLTYTDTGLQAEDIFTQNTLDADFVSGFLQGDQQYDLLKSLLQLNSFTNIQNPATAFPASETSVHLHHSPFDRLVPMHNTTELSDLLQPVVTTQYMDDTCNSVGLQLVSEAVDKTGIVHSLCGLNMLDRVLEMLR